MTYIHLLLGFDVDHGCRHLMHKQSTSSSVVEESYHHRFAELPLSSFFSLFFSLPFACVFLSSFLPVYYLYKYLSSPFVSKAFVTGVLVKIKNLRFLPSFLVLLFPAFGYGRRTSGVT
jgi:hypothetical protein